jgi:hypothetical protein
MPGRPEEEGRAARVRPFLGMGGTWRPPEEDAPGEAGLPDRAVRPYLVTSGRVVSAAVLPVETQVETTDRGRRYRRRLSFEYRDLVVLCAVPLAVAEIAGRMRQHLGVIRVLVSDLERQGFVRTVLPEETVDTDTILRVMHGLRQR